eukprot:GSMAST32.ASY1.ANO1.1207.1 assembled CDS
MWHYTSLFPIIKHLKSYNNWSTFFRDVFAGLTVGIILLPQGLADAQLAGVPHIWGLYGGLFPLVLFAIFANSQHITIGPVTVISLFVGSLVQSVTNCNEQPTAECEDYRIVMIAATFLVGIIQLCLALLRVGKIITDALSVEVIKGYISACAFAIATSQLQHFFQVKICKQCPIYNSWGDLFRQLSMINMYSLGLGLSCMTLLLILKYLSPRQPSELFVIIMSTLFTWGLDLHAEPYNVKIVGSMTKGFPAPELPFTKVKCIFQSDCSLLQHPLSSWHKLISGAVVCAIVSYIISLSLVKEFAMKYGTKVNGNQDLFALGMANVFGSFFNCYAIAASLSRSAAFKAAGGKTQIASLVTASLIAITLLFLTRLFYYLPSTALAAVIFVSLRSLLKGLFFGPYLWRIGQLYSLLTWAITVVSTFLLGITYGLVIGVSVSFVLIFFRLWYHNDISNVLFSKYDNLDKYVSLFNKKNCNSDTDLQDLLTQVHPLLQMNPCRYFIKSSVCFLNINIFHRDIEQYTSLQRMWLDSRIMKYDSGDSSLRQHFNSIIKSAPLGIFIPLVLDFSKVNFVDVTFVQFLKAFIMLQVERHVVLNTSTEFSMRSIELNRSMIHTYILPVRIYIACAKTEILSVLDQSGILKCLLYTQMDEDDDEIGTYFDLVGDYFNHERIFETAEAAIDNVVSIMNISIQSTNTNTSINNDNSRDSLVQDFVMEEFISNFLVPLYHLPNS